MNVRLILCALLGAAWLAACGNGGASEPPITQVDPASSTKLQFAVGIATISYGGGQNVAYGLNTISTLRQSDGLSGTLYNIPRIQGPSQFRIENSVEGGIAPAAGADLNSNHITWATLNQTQWIGAQRGIKQATTGVFGYGLCPCNADAGGQNGTPSLYQAFLLPIYGNTSNDLADEAYFYGGPPAFPVVGPSLAAYGFSGYSLGFTDFAVAPVLGTYQLQIAVPPAYLTPGLPTPSPAPGVSPTPGPVYIAATAQLASLKALPAFPIPSLTADNKGGGTIHIVEPTGTREAMVVVRAVGKSGSASGPCTQAHTSDEYYTVVAHGAGAHALTLPDNLGPAEAGGAASPSICPGGNYFLYAAGFDYDAYEASYPQNLDILPTITGPNGQADVTTSDVFSGTYP